MVHIVIPSVLWLPLLVTSKTAFYITVQQQVHFHSGLVLTTSLGTCCRPVIMAVVSHLWYSSCFVTSAHCHGLLRYILQIIWKVRATLNVVYLTAIGITVTRDICTIHQLNDMFIAALRQCSFRHAAADKTVYFQLWQLKLCRRVATV